MLAVEAVTRREIRVAHHFGPEHLAILQRRDARLIQIRQLDALKLGRNFHLGREPADPNRSSINV